VRGNLYRKVEPYLDYTAGDKMTAFAAPLVPPTSPPVIAEKVFFDLQGAPAVEMSPGSVYRALHTDNFTIVLWDLDKGAPLPPHSHPHQQTTILLEGRYRLVVGGIPSENGPGSIAVIPGGVEHSGEALEKCRVIDIFVPARRDRFRGLEQSAI
jgi:quercetin dioxygenase-like cupin family protein